MLRSGDIVRVEQREDNKIFVTGEVGKPTSLLMRNGRMTLNEALGDAGGVNPGTANADLRHPQSAQRRTLGVPPGRHFAGGAGHCRRL